MSRLGTHSERKSSQAAGQTRFTYYRTRSSRLVRITEAKGSVHARSDEVVAGRRTMAPGGSGGASLGSQSRCIAIGVPVPARPEVVRGWTTYKTTPCSFVLLGYNWIRQSRKKRKNTKRRGTARTSHLFFCLFSGLVQTRVTRVEGILPSGDAGILPANRRRDAFDTRGRDVRDTNVANAACPDD